MSHIEGNNIKIKEIISELNHLSSQKDKSDFIKKHAELKAKIEQIDNILNSISTIDLEMDINELFKILENGVNVINDNQDLDIYSLKMLLDIIKILKEKIQSGIMNVINIK